ncbi:hypothetical protein N7489_002817 [Penicillium chrysogenum]|uniref:uncharacterized protein n=1 Tax=Penicillium chrysogenum TaxID=5076 RepID=UPI0024DF2BEF|nr:uncharacterized protein N7489_002817 [Penicillium chrysogenum]KAJ5252407.1 hypothetical protein N7489_002817 [Penicillium chrysogenum]KAJ5854513.1 hypothetical protein N7534_007056 [Penicillium rubens]
MESSVTYLVTAITAIATEYSRKKLKWDLDIRVECLCWAILYLGLRFRPKVLKLLAADSDDGLLSQKPESKFNWMAWITSLFIAVARILAVYYDTTLALSTGTGD